MITITESAQTKIAQVLAEEKNPLAKIRMFVYGGGCSGFQYGFEITETKEEDDIEVSAGTVSMLIDSMTMQYVAGSSVDYVEDLAGSRFAIHNPMAKNTCGCGSSFNPY